MFSKMWQWVNERWPLTTVFRWGLEEAMSGGTSYAYVFGSATLIIFLLQILTGIWQLLYYVPSIDYAYSSINYLRIEVPFGWLIHGIHYWGAQLMVVFIGLHIFRVFIWKAYQQPRQLIWLIGIVLLLITLGMSFTGAPLPWDERGYWAAEVGTSMAGTVPVIGDFIKRLLRGGESMGQLTLSRFFILHVAILPGTLIAMIGAHIVAFRQFGAAGPWDKEKAKKTGPFWPDQVFKDAIVGVLLLLFLMGLATFNTPTFMGQADPLDNTYSPKPEWNFLFLYQALKAFKGPWEPVGTIGLPIIIVLVFILIPFVDKRKQRNPLKRPVAILAFIIGIAGLLALTVAGKLSRPNIAQGQAPMPTRATKPSQMSASASQGMKLFQTVGCVTCHSIHGVGGKIGPDLSQERSKGHTKEWITTQILDPKKHDPSTIMPAMTNLSQQQVNDLADYLLSLNGGSSASSMQSDTSAQKSNMTKTAANGSEPGKTMGGTSSSTESTQPATSTHPKGLAINIIGNVEHGHSLFVQQCQSCHGKDGTDKVPNPGSTRGTVPPLNPISRELFNSNALIFVKNIDQFIQHGATPGGPNPELSMPNFGDASVLTQQEISNIQAYILHLNGVNRAQIQHPGIAPNKFFFLTIGVFALLGVVLGIGWVRQRSNAKTKT